MTPTPAVRTLERRACVWAFLIDAIPLYPLYALLFASRGMSQAAISALFALWAAVSLIAEVPTGALADRVSRRAMLVAASVFQAAGFATWILWPRPWAFALGFVLWGIGTSLISGTLEALVYDGLAAEGASSLYARVRGRVAAWGMVGQVPAGIAATPLFLWGGYPAVGAVSVAASLAAAAVAAFLPDREPAGEHAGGDEPGCLEMLGQGVREAVGSSLVRAALVASALLLSLEALEEYDVLLADEWGVPTAWVPLTVVWLPLFGAAGAALAGRFHHATPSSLALALGAGVALVAAAGVARVPAGLLAIAVFYGVFRAVRVIVDMRLQDRIRGRARATVTSSAEFLGGVVGIAAFGLWALWGLWGMLALAVVAVAFLAWWSGDGRDGGVPGHFG